LGKNLPFRAFHYEVAELREPGVFDALQLQCINNAVELAASKA